MAGFKGDAHEFVKKELVPKATPEKPLLLVLEELTEEDPSLAEVVNRIPEEVHELLRFPEEYIGLAVEKARLIVQKAKNTINSPK